MRWTAWNVIFLVALIQAHNSNIGTRGSLLSALLDLTLQDDVSRILKQSETQSRRGTKGLRQAATLLLEPMVKRLLPQSASVC